MPTDPPWQRVDPRPKPVLTARQVAVLEKLAEGKSFKVIAHELGVTHSAVRARLLSAKQKLGARNMPHALVLALSRRLIVGPESERGNGGR
jgi:LuxR family transcriptional regulator